MLYHVMGKRQLHLCQSHLEKEIMQIPFFLLVPSWPLAVQLLSPCCHAGAWLFLHNVSHGPDHHALVYAMLATSSPCQCVSALLWLNFLQQPNKTSFLPGIQLLYFKYTALHTDKVTEVFSRISHC